MGATIARRIGFGLVVVGLIAWWVIAQQTKPHYSDVPGQGVLLQRLELPALDTAQGGPIPLPPSAKDLNAVHYPAQPAAVEAPIAVPGAVTDRTPDGTAQDPQAGHQPGIGSAVHDNPMPGTPGFDQSPFSLPLPTCDAACVQRVLAGLGITIPPIPIPPVVTP